MDLTDHQLLTTDSRVLAMLQRREVRAPFVTVVVTVFNYERYVADCLQSIAAQTYRNFKCLVIDDCSSDRSVEVIEQFIAERQLGERFLLIRHETNQGQMAGFKTGCERAEGEFVVYVDADDLLLPDFLVGHLAVHLGEMPVAFTSSDQYQINEAGEVIAGRHSDLLARGRYRHVGPHYLYENSWLWATTSSMMFRRATLQMILPDVTEPFRVCADNYICHFGNLVGGSILIPERLGCYRRHGANSFSKNRIVGGQHPTGDMRTHPHHASIRQAMVDHLLNHSDRFISVLAGWWFLVLLARVVMFGEALRIAVDGTWSAKIRMPRHYVLPFLVRSLVNRVRWKLRFFLAFGPTIHPIAKRRRNRRTD
jgi:glycosyltransferase involved in cell wall biosynthesis